MLSDSHVKRPGSLIDPGLVPVYDGHDLYPDPDEGDLLELPGPRARYEQLAAQLRRDIYAGMYAPGSVLPAEVTLAETHRMSRALVNRALQVLADEELVSQEQGRGTYVRRRRLYRVVIDVPRPAGVPVAADADLLPAVTAAAAAEPAAKKIEHAGLRLGQARLSMLIEAADGDWAVHAAKMVTRSARGSWSWDGWDLTLAVYRSAPTAGLAEARPADGDQAD